MFTRICQVAVVVFATGISAANATEACGERSAIIDQLQGKYQENHVASGLESDSKMVEIWTSQASGTWTILVTQANGISCIAAAGKNWLDLPPEAMPLGTAS